MSWLTRTLGISGTANDRVGEGTEALKKGTEVLVKGTEKIGTATEFLVNVAGKMSASDSPSFFDAIETAVPWIENTTEVIGDALPPVKAVLKVIEFLTKETDPRALGLLAFSLAYQSALVDSIQAIKTDPANEKVTTGKIDKKLLGSARAASQDSLQEFDNFRLESCFRHPLLIRTDAALDNLANASGWPDNLRRKLLEGLHARFAPAFRMIISDGRTKDKFDSLFRFMNIGPVDTNSFTAIERHINYQIWRFNEAPVLGRA
jgi:hypothetical protein